MRVALVHDWLVTMRGGERVLEAIAELYPNADVFTLLHRPGAVSSKIESHRIRTSFLQRIPGIYRTYRHFLPLFPKAIESFDLFGYDLIISSSHCVAKGVRIPPGAKHVSYIHSPMRYMWDQFDNYFGPGRAGLTTRIAARLARPYLQAWDEKTAAVTTRFVANSRHIADKIQKFWRRPAVVVYPPVDVERFRPAEGVKPGDYYLWVGAMAPYKRLDLALDVFRRLQRPFWIVGSGPDARRLKTSLPPNIRVIGSVADEELPKLFAQARALIFPGEEDFGLVPLESLAAGRPVIAFDGGGVRESLTPETAVLFDEPSADALCQAVLRFEAWEPRFDSSVARAQAAKFHPGRFRQEFTRQIEAAYVFQDVSRAGQP